MDLAEARRALLVTEYEMLSKFYDVQFTHFMGVFYFWIATVGAPTTAGAVSSSGGIDGSSMFGLICIGAGLLGTFLAAKMFDIRHSQLRYISKMNEIRLRLWDSLAIEAEEHVAPLGRGADLVKVARSDFGIVMARCMAGVNGSLVGLGIYIISCSLSGRLAIACGGGIVVVLLNLWNYNHYVIRKLAVTVCVSASPPR
jgi:hypothetical protein